MPCMGPSWDRTLPKKITEDFLSILKEKYNIGNNGLDNENYQFDFDNELKTKLLSLIEEIIESDAYNGF